jgi:hypothetical protein
MKRVVTSSKIVGSNFCVNEWLLFLKRQVSHFQLFLGENKLHFDDVMIFRRSIHACLLPYADLHIIAEN